MKNILLILVSILLTSLIYAQNETEKSNSSQANLQIRVKIENYPYDIIQLGYHFNNRQYLTPDAITKTDTIYKQPDGFFVINIKEPIKPGIYLLIVQPNNNYSEILITQNDRNIEISSDYNNLIESMQFDAGSFENRLFYDYLKFIQKKKEEVKALPQDEINSGQSDKTMSINDEVSAYQNDIIKVHPNSFTAALIKSTLTVKIPEFEGSEMDKQNKRFYYYRQHYFDNIDLTDPRMVRTPILFNSVENYINKLQVQHPDSISNAIDFVLKKMEPSEETYKNYVVHFLNKYAESKIMGMDAVYVHMADNYYAKGKTPWIDEAQLQKILKKSNAIKPTLIGKVAPNMALESNNGFKFDLHDIKSKYTLLFFWNDNCGLCAKSIKDLIEVNDKLENLDVELVAICTRNAEEVKNCWDYATNWKINEWFHVKVDSENDLVSSTYNFTSSKPKIFVLDSNKNIIGKNLGADQIVDFLIKFNKN
ncbi:DUF5106 domain-containing protein [Winogradskyella sp. A2]|uniref:DUF5106 domain-containing protein n=1 Tax=Winogradskyella sp. A2 TaxID=3366944 RepID=UPI00398C73F5